MRYTREFSDKLGYEVVKSKLKSKVSEKHCASKQKKIINKKHRNYPSNDMSTEIAPLANCQEIYII